MHRRQFLIRSGQTTALALCASSVLPKSSLLGQDPQQTAAGPLRVSAKNPRYFCDASGREMLLVGSHTWNNLTDMGLTDPPAPFDFPAYLVWMRGLNHNFMRLWAWEPSTWNTKNNRRNALLHVAPLPWARTGPGRAASPSRPRS